MLTFSSLGGNGQLGNQLFQIASTIGIARSNNHTPVFGKWGYATQFPNFFPYIKPVVINTRIGESGLNYTPVKLHHDDKSVVDLAGFFQSEKYFSGSKDEIKKVFTFSPTLVEKMQNKYNDLHQTCSIHVRRSDYVNNPHYEQLSRYYKNCASHFLQRNISQKYLVFSDDVSWCEKAFPSIPIAKGNSNIEDLCLMSLCQNNIIANSTFSWWAAWINNNPTKIVLAPNKWFGPGYTRGNPHAGDDIVCSEWVKIGN